MGRAISSPHILILQKRQRSLRIINDGSFGAWCLVRMIADFRGGMMRGSRTWALVMDGTRARILRGVMDHDGEDTVELVSRSPSTHLRDIMADRPGRSFSSGSAGRRSGKELGSDPILRDMQDFATETTDVLEKHRRAGDFARLAVFAEPKMLGILRAECPTALWDTVFLDMPLNLVALSERDLRSRVLAEIENHA